MSITYSPWPAPMSHYIGGGKGTQSDFLNRAPETTPPLHDMAQGGVLGHIHILCLVFKI